jgi:hypothetical protein
MTLQEKLCAALNKLTKWRCVFAGWQLGTRPDTDPECLAVRDHRDATILLRAELSTITSLLLNEGFFTQAQYQNQLLAEVEMLDAAYEKLFPGFRTSTVGVTIDPVAAKETTRGWRP